MLTNFPPSQEYLDSLKHRKDVPAFGWAFLIGLGVATAWAPVVLLPLLGVFGLILWVNHLNTDKMYDRINKANGHK